MPPLFAFPVWGPRLARLAWAGELAHGLQAASSKNVFGTHCKLQRHSAGGQRVLNRSVGARPGLAFLGRELYILFFSSGALFFGANPNWNYVPNATITVCALAVGGRRDAVNFGICFKLACQNDSPTLFGERNALQMCSAGRHHACVSVISWRLPKSVLRAQA